MDWDLDRARSTIGNPRPNSWWDRPKPKPPVDPPPPLVLRGTVLRYVLIYLLRLHSPRTIPELVDGLQKWGFAVEGRPSKTVSDALRWERRRGRVERRGRGRYIAGDVARSTEYRIIRRVEALREQAMREQAMRDQPVRDQAMRDQPVRDQPMRDQAISLSLRGGHDDLLSLRGGQQRHTSRSGDQWDEWD